MISFFFLARRTKIKNPKINKFPFLTLELESFDLILDGGVTEVF